METSFSGKVFNDVSMNIEKLKVSCWNDAIRLKNENAETFLSWFQKIREFACDDEEIIFSIVWTTGVYLDYIAKNISKEDAKSLMDYSEARINDALKSVFVQESMFESPQKAVRPQVLPFRSR